MKIAWITDSTSGLSPEEAKKHNIHVIPLSVIFGNEIFKEGIDITNEEFYTKLEAIKDLPTSSQPTVGETVAFYENLKKDYDIGIAIHVSSELSGTFQNSLSAAEMADFPLVGIDSRTGAAPVFSMVLEGQRLHKEGKEVKDIEIFLNDMAKKAKACLLIGSLEQVAKGGRVSHTQALIGNLLKINLLIKLEDGKLIPSDKIRTTSKAKKKVLQTLLDSYQSNKKIHHLSVVSTTTPQEAQEWADWVKNECNGLQCNIAGLSPVIGVHGGAGTIGFFWFED